MIETIQGRRIHPRERLLRDTFTPAESLTFWAVLITASLASVIATPRSFWLLGFFLIVGVLTPAMVKVHEHTHPFIIDALWKRYWQLSAPAWLFCLQFIVGLLHNPLSSFEFNGQLYQQIESTSAWQPTSVKDTNTWLSVLTYVSIYLLALNLYIIPKSRAFFERIFPPFCLIAVILAVFGYLQKALNLDSPIFTRGTGQADFFAFFPYDGHWAAFATLWAAVCVAMALLTTSYDDSGDFIDSSGPWYLTGATLLGLSGFAINAVWPSTVLLLSFSVLLLIVAINFLTRTIDRHRNRIALFCGLGSTVIFAGTVVRLYQNYPIASEYGSLRLAALKIFSEKPFFGWGFDSFAQLAPFYNADILLNERHERAVSDVLQYLAELGIFGALLLPIAACYLLIKYQHQIRNVLLSQHMLIGCGAVILLAFCDSPLMSPAVFLSLLVVFFSALRWAKLSRTETDLVDARPQLVVPQWQRKVPFFAGEYKDISK